MAQLKFDGIQPVTFGGQDCTPKLDAEIRLRLNKLEFGTEAQTEQADKILSDCFPDDKDYVLDFLKSQMSPYEKRELQAYLIGGPSMVRLIRDKIDNITKEAMEEAE